MSCLKPHKFRFEHFHTIPLHDRDIFISNIRFVLFLVYLESLINYTIELMSVMLYSHQLDDTHIRLTYAL